jgi:hypothetical protein
MARKYGTSPRGRGGLVRRRKPFRGALGGLATGYLTYQLQQRNLATHEIKHYQEEILSLPGLSTDHREILRGKMRRLFEIIDMDSRLLYSLWDSTIKGGPGRGASLREKNMESSKKSLQIQARISDALERHYSGRGDANRIPSVNELAARLAPELNLGKSTLRKYLSPFVERWRLLDQSNK